MAEKGWKTFEENPKDKERLKLGHLEVPLIKTENFEPPQINFLNVKDTSLTFSNCLYASRKVYDCNLTATNISTHNQLISQQNFVLCTHIKFNSIINNSHILEQEIECFISIFISKKLSRNMFSLLQFTSSIFSIPHFSFCMEQKKIELSCFLLISTLL